jgi:hypothetical protein
MTSSTGTLAKLDRRLLLAALWVARMLSGIQGDTFRLSDKDALRSILEGASQKGFLLAMAIVFVFPILMGPLTLVLRPSLGRWANRVAATFFALFDLVFVGLCLFMWHSTGSELLWSFIYPIFTLSLAWQSWSWSGREPEPSHRGEPRGADRA